MKLNENLLNRIKEIRWFENCGHSFLTEEGSTIKFVDSWELAMKNCSHINWENTSLDARGELTVFLHNKYQTQYMQWNNLVDLAKCFMELEVYPYIEKTKESFGLDEGFCHSVKWDILHVILEDAYSKYYRKTFFRDLLEVYEKGNFPCGWEGKWPKGNLIVY
ncbi:hypothetical protein ACFQZE_10265 [Paenibacillus sp. GCM10027627]|uniref:hypothetical protein n=1 Tax=unclassified Paenibacillus TaxID=185978 RepID=UPI003635E975